MKAFLTLIGIILFALGIAAGIYVGFWVMLVGGLLEIIDAIKAPVTSASEIGFGLLRMIFSSAVGAITFWVCTAISAGFFALAE
jgi:hypothetical protein